MICVFVARLPKRILELLEASARMDKLTLNEIIIRAQAIMANDRGYRQRIATAAQQPCTSPS